jgi:MFS family permease
MSQTPDILPANSIRRYRKRQLVLFLIGIGSLGITAGLYEPSFNNFLDDIYHLGDAQRGFLEFPRELPGFLVALFAGTLFFLSETSIATVCSLVVGVGLMGLAWCVSGLPLGVMITFMIIWSIGNHLLMPIRRSLTMHLAGRGGKNRGKLLGNTSALMAGAMMIGAGIVFVVTDRCGANYRLFFILGAAATVVAAVAFGLMRMPRAHLARPKWIFRKKYGLYYALTLLWGDRKQVFLTFGPWLIVRYFGRDAATIAMLWLIGSGLGIFAQPMLGRLIDRFGERAILVADGICGISVCLVYAFAPSLSVLGVLGEWTVQGHTYTLDGPGLALGIVLSCYVADHLLTGSGMARVTYLTKIADSPADIAPTLSMGVTLDHFSSMLAPIWAGMLWAAFGFQFTFLYAACLAAVTLVLAWHIRTPERP